MSSITSNRLLVLASLLAALGLAGCGGGRAYRVEDVRGSGDIEVSNATDVGGTWEDLYYFAVARAGSSVWTGNLLPEVVYPGAVVYVGTFEEDVYDAEAELDFHTAPFFDVFVQSGYTTSFEVY